MSYTMLQSSWFILNKRFIYDHYALREMPVVSLYQQILFFLYSKDCFNFGNVSYNRNVNTMHLCNFSDKYSKGRKMCSARIHLFPYSGFSWFSSVPPGECHDRFLSNPFQFIIHLPPFYLTPYGQSF
jgi:hypothetical protein